MGDLWFVLSVGSGNSGGLRGPRGCMQYSSVVRSAVHALAWALPTNNLMTKSLWRELWLIVVWGLFGRFAAKNSSAASPSQITASQPVRSCERWHMEDSWVRSPSLSPPRDDPIAGTRGGIRCGGVVHRSRTSSSFAVAISRWMIGRDKRYLETRVRTCTAKAGMSVHSQYGLTLVWWYSNSHSNCDLEHSKLSWSQSTVNRCSKNFPPIPRKSIY